MPFAIKKEDNGGLVSRNLDVLGRRTSVRLESEMWDALFNIAQQENCHVRHLCSLIAMRKKPGSSLTSAIRTFVMLYYRAAATAEGHEKAGHGSFRKMVARAKVALDSKAQKLLFRSGLSFWAPLQMMIAAV